MVMCITRSTESFKTTIIKAFIASYMYFSTYLSGVFKPVTSVPSSGGWSKGLKG